MTDLTFFQQHLAAAETALWNLKKHRDDIDREIEALDAVIKIERALVYREEPESNTPHIAGMPRWGSGRSRIKNAVEKMLAEHGTLHRKEIHARLHRMGLAQGDAKGLAYISSRLSLFGLITDHNGNWSLPQNRGQEVMSE